MDDFSEYLKQTSEELKVLQGDITRMIVAKQKQLKETKKDKEGTQKNKEGNIETGQDKKTMARDQFKKISLKSIQPVTKLYKNEKEIEEANDNPEEDFISNRLKEIFNR